MLTQEVGRKPIVGIYLTKLPQNPLKEKFTLCYLTLTCILVNDFVFSAHLSTTWDRHQPLLTVYFHTISIMSWWNLFKF